jgi:hypothetical protein
MPAPLPLTEVARRLQQGEPLRRADLQGTFGPTAAVQPALAATDQGSATTAGRCQVRLLEAPMLDDGRAIVFGNPAKAKEVEQQLRGLGITHGPLDDVVVLHTGAFVRVDLLLFVRRDLLPNRRVVARALDAAGQQIFAVPATNADVTPPKALPAHWIDPTGPWAGSIAELLAWQAQTRWIAVYLRLPKAPSADRVEIGALRDPNAPPAPQPGVATSDKAIVPAYYIAAIGELAATELERHDWDETQIDRDRQTITNALGPASSDNALLFADSLYRITATWTGARDSDGAARGAETQTYWFKTDRIDGEDADPPKPVFASTPPLSVRLDPWMLVTLPADRETAWFGGEPTRLVFNTHDVDGVFAAYGKELRVRFQAASARHPAGGGAIPHPFPINATTIVPLAAAILSPWEDAATAVLDDTCIPIDEDRVRHSEVDIPIPLEPFTDYILDVEMVDLGAPESASGPSIYRRHFSTGAFATLDAFAASLQAARPTARACEPGALEAIRAHFAGRTPQGAELDDQFRAQGIEPLIVPDRARIVVFWSQAADGLPQPAGVLIDATEPLWRSRPYPNAVADDSGPVPAQRWVLADTEWLELQDQSSAGVVAGNGLIRAPGGQRALIVLAANARGETLRVELVSKAFPALAFLNQVEHRATLIELPLDHAPWEEI